MFVHENREPRDFRFSTVVDSFDFYIVGNIFCDVVTSPLITCRGNWFVWCGNILKLRIYILHRYFISIGWTIELPVTSISVLFWITVDCKSKTGSADILTVGLSDGSELIMASRKIRRQEPWKKERRGDRNLLLGDPRFLLFVKMISSLSHEVI